MEIRDEIAHIVRTWWTDGMFQRPSSQDIADQILTLLTKHGFIDGNVEAKGWVVKGDSEVRCIHCKETWTVPYKNRFDTFHTCMKGMAFIKSHARPALNHEVIAGKATWTGEGA